VYAHLSQFAEPGWKYLQGQGSGFLSGGGAFCALISPDGAQLTILIETLAGPNCTTTLNCPTAAQNASFVLPTSVLKRQTEEVTAVKLEVWESELETNDPAGYMIKRPASRTPIVKSDGSFELPVPLNRLVTITTNVGLAQKGRHPPPPPQAPFPMPYSVNYSTLPLSRQGPLLNDQQGSYEIQRTEQGITGLVQTVKVPPVNWVHGTPRPLTLFGDPTWTDMVVKTTAIILEESTIANTTIFNCTMASAFRPGGALGVTTLPAPVGGSFVSVGARVVSGGNVCNAGKLDRRGYFFTVHANCTFSITKSSQHVLSHGALSIGACKPADGQQQAAPSLVGTKLELEIEVVGLSISGRVGGQTVATVHDSEYTAGFASMAGGWHRALFAEVSVHRGAERSG
jgi:hypothetical protein